MSANSGNLLAASLTALLFLPGAWTRRKSEPGTGWGGVLECNVYWVDAKVLEAFRR